MKGSGGEGGGGLGSGGGGVGGLGGGECEHPPTSFSNMSPCTANGGHCSSIVSDHDQHFETDTESSLVALGRIPEAHWKLSSGGGGDERGDSGGGGEGGGYCNPDSRSACMIFIGVMMFEPSCETIHVQRMGEFQIARELCGLKGPHTWSGEHAYSLCWSCVNSDHHMHARHSVRAFSPPAEALDESWREGSQSSPEDGREIANALSTGTDARKWAMSTTLRAC